MQSLNTTLKVIVIPYFKENSAFFMLAVFILFGFLRSAEHIAIANYIVNDLWLTGFVTLLWSLYVIKTILFTKRQLHAPSNYFIRELYLYPLGIRNVNLIAVQMILMLPISAYGVFLLFFAKINQQDLSMILIVTGLTLFTFIPPILYYHWIKKPISESWFMKRNIINISRRPFFLWHLEYLLRSRPFTLFFTTSISILLIIGLFHLGTLELYDERWIYMVSLTAFSTNSVLIHNIYEFYHNKLNWTRNVPVPYAHVIKNHFILVLILNLPVISILIRYYPDGYAIQHLGESVIFGLSFHWSLLRWMHFQYRDIEKFGKMCFYIFLLLFVLFLMQLAIWWVISLLCLFILTSYKYQYQSYHN